MDYRDRRNDHRDLRRQREGALGFALLSGHGAGLFLCVITPLQLAGRVTPQFMGLVMIGGAGLALLFGYGVVHSWNALALDVEGDKADVDRRQSQAVAAGLRAFVVVVGLLAIGGLSMFSADFRAFAFNEGKTSNP